MTCATATTSEDADGGPEPEEESDTNSTVLSYRPLHCGQTRRRLRQTVWGPPGGGRATRSPDRDVMTYVCAEAQEHAVAEVTRMSGRPAAGPRLSIVPANKIRRYHVTNPARQPTLRAAELHCTLEASLTRPDNTVLSTADSLARLYRAARLH